MRIENGEKRTVVCVQGLGYVGAAMSTAIAAARDANGTPMFDVVGVDLDTEEGQKRIAAINNGKFPFPTADDELAAAVATGHTVSNLRATSDPACFALASVVVVDIPLNVNFSANRPTCDLNGFRSGIRTIASRIKPGTLLLIETTVPPGTTERVVRPLLQEMARIRGFSEDAFLIAHSYERVMPGRDYLRSITNYWRVYSGDGYRAAERCEDFLSRVINVAEYPLTRLTSPTASETAKLLENSYRAATIALMEEWGRFAERIGLDLFEVINAVRKRPTHSNMRQPGFGVGGYCLTKDPLLLSIGARELFGIEDLQFPFAQLTIRCNQEMPLATVNHLRTALGSLHNRRILLLGVSYLPDIGDTRYSPSETFANSVLREGAHLEFHDPLVASWPETGLKVLTEIPTFQRYDAVVFATAHRQYRDLDIAKHVGTDRPLIFDANGVLSEPQLQTARRIGCSVFCIGRGCI